jgi:uncharacterized protein RhaS with RHS repeats
VNPYGYVHNPLSWVDPLGLACCPPKVPNYHKANFTDGLVTSRHISGDEIFYKYHGETNRLGRDFNYVTKKKYSSENALREDLAILNEWGGNIDRVTTFKPAKGTRITQGTAAPQLSSDGFESLAGGGYQGIINIKELSNPTIINTKKVNF